MSTNKIEKIVYFVRHGESEDNVAPVFQSPNSPLNEKGWRQAERVAERVAKLHFGALIASPFERAKQTAEAISRATGANAEYCDLFVERVKPTSINGKPYTDEKANTLWREWQKSLYTSGARTEDGENFDDLLTRADNALAFLSGRNEESLVVVTHGYFLRTIVARVLLRTTLSGEAFRQFQKSATMENTGLTVLRYHDRFEEEPSWRLWIYNDHAHLDQNLRTWSVKSAPTQSG
jgi:broad specificity phosphatase PhoE